MIEKIVFEIGGFFSGYKQVKIWAEDEKVFKAYNGDFNDSDNEYAVEFQEEEIKVLEGRLSQLKINGWKREYVDSEILDGIQWELEYKEQGKRCIHIYGSNDYPECWNDFMEALGEVIPEMLSEKISLITE